MVNTITVEVGMAANLVTLSCGCVIQFKGEDSGGIDYCSVHEDAPEDAVMEMDAAKELLAEAAEWIRWMTKMEKANN